MALQVSAQPVEVNTMNISIFSFTRFSLVTNSTLGSFRATRGKTIEEAEAAIFSEERIAQRLSLFKGFCLPTLKVLADKHQEFYSYIFVSQMAPKTMIEALHEAVAGHKQIEIVYFSHNDSVKSVSRQLVSRSATADFFSMRLDDDDALSPRFVEKVHEVYIEERTEDCLSFSSGYTVYRNKNGLFMLSRSKYVANAFGLGVFSDKANLKTVFDLGNHALIRQTRKLHVDDTDGMWLSPIYDGNDSLIDNSGPIHRLNKARRVSHTELTCFIEKRFPHLSVDAIEALSIANVD